MKIDNTRVDVNLRLADEYQNLGIISDAMNHLQTVVSNYDQQGKTRDMLGILQRIVELDTENIANRIKLAELYSREKMVSEAVAEFGRAALDLKRQNRMEDFVKVVERLIYHDASNITLIKELAGAYLQQGDTKRALAKLQICFKADPHDLDTLQMLATSFRDLHQLSKTVSVYKEMANIYQKGGASDKLREIFQRILEIAPDDPVASRYLSGGGFSFSEVDDSAIEDQTQVSLHAPPTKVVKSTSPNLTLRPHEPEVTVKYARPRAPASISEQARSSVSRLLTETDVYIKYGLQSKAIQHLNRIFEMDSDNIEAHTKLRDLYLMAGQRENAAQQMLNLAYLTSRRGMLEDARGHVGSLLTIAPDHPQGLALAAELGLEVDQRPSHPNAGDDVLLDQGADFDLDEQPLIADVDFAIEVDDEGAAQSSEKMDEPLAPEDELSVDEISDSPADLTVEELDDETEFIDLEQDGDFVADEDIDELSLDADVSLDAEESLEGANLSEAPTTLYLRSIPKETLKPAEGRVTPDHGTKPPPLGSAAILGHDTAVGVQSRDQEVLIEGESTDAGPDQYADELLLDAEGEETDIDNAVLGDDGLLEHRDVELLSQGEEGHDLIGDEILIGSADADSEESADVIDGAEREDEAELVVEAEEAKADQAEAEIQADASKESEASPVVEESEDDAEVEEAIEEVDFFIQQNLVDEAEDAIQDLKLRYSGRIDVRQRLTRIEQLRQSQSIPAQIPTDRSTSSGAVGSAGGTDAFDLAKEIESQAIDDIAAAPLDEFQYSAEDVLSEFKKGVERVVEKEDSATHFDLGIAYKEMGLVDDAVCEFEIASHDAKRRISALTLIGLCHIEKAHYNDAISFFRKALNEPSILDQEKTGLYYEIGRAFELQNNLTQALAFYQQVQKRDDHFRDIGARLELLKRSAIGNDDGAIDPKAPTEPHRPADKGKITYM